MSDIPERGNSTSSRVFSVAEINSYIKRMFDEDFLLENVTVTGEISGCKNGLKNQEGHIYLNLKDNSGIIPAVIWKSTRYSIGFDLKDGDKVEASGNISVYEPYGKYQLYIKKIKKAGEGDLFARFQELKRTMEEEGYFDPAHKKPIPKYIKRLGVITAATGAAVRDIINVTHRRNPGVEIILYPAVVQGDGAAPTLIEGIRVLDSIGVDTIIIGRGGGSIEDLWAFNEASVAMAIYNCETPIISAVGHEVDFSISDFVADLRAATPSAAAELAVYNLEEEKRRLKNAFDSMKKIMDSRLMMWDKKQENLYLRLSRRSPHNIISIREQNLKQLCLRLEKSNPSRKLELMEERLRNLSDTMDRDFSKHIDTGEQKLKNLCNAMTHRIGVWIDRDENRLLRLSEVINANAPMKKITGGYAFVMKANGLRLESVVDAKKGDEISLTMHDGVLKATVDEVAVQSVISDTEDVKTV